MVGNMHRTIELIETGIKITAYHSDHNNHTENHRAIDMVEMIKKVAMITHEPLEEEIFELLMKRKKKRESMTEWNLKKEAVRAFNEAFPFLPTLEREV